MIQTAGASCHKQEEPIPSASESAAKIKPKPCHELIHTGYQNLVREQELALEWPLSVTSYKMT